MAEENQDTKLSQEQPQISSNPSRSSGHSTGLAGAPKTSWPELVGLTAEEAEKKVKEDFPRAEIQVVPPNHLVTMDYRTSRVRIHVDSSGKVERPPRTG